VKGWFIHFAGYQTRQRWLSRTLTRELPPELLDEIIAFSYSLPGAHVISLDSREAYITPAALRRVLPVAGDGVVARPILVIESADNRIRNEVLRKRMPQAAIDCVFRDLDMLAAELGPGKIGIEVNIVIAGPGTTPENAIEDAVMMARFVFLAGAENGVNVDLNLHPYYVGFCGSALFPD